MIENLISAERAYKDSQNNARVRQDKAIADFERQVVLAINTAIQNGDFSVHVKHNLKDVCIDPIVDRLKARGFSVIKQHYKTFSKTGSRLFVNWKERN